MEKLIIWDFDKTLAYRDAGWSQTIIKIAKDHHVSITYDELHPLMNSGLPWHEFEKTHKELLKKKTWWEYVEEHIKNALNKLGVHKAEEISKEFRGVFIDPQYWHLYDDTIETLEALKQAGYKMIIASNNFPELDEVVKALGIEDYFEKVITSASLEYEKPNVHFFKEVLKGYEECEITMIGDNYNADIRGAIYAGIKNAILVHNPNKMRYDYSSATLKGILEFMN